MQTFTRVAISRIKQLATLLTCSTFSLFCLSTSDLHNESNKVLKLKFKNSNIRSVVALKHYILLEKQQLKNRQILGKLTEVRNQVVEIKQHLLEWESILQTSSTLFFRVAQANQRVVIDRQNNWRVSKEILLYLLGFKWLWGVFTDFSPSTSIADSVVTRAESMQLFRQQYKTLTQQLSKKQEVLQSALTKMQESLSLTLTYINSPVIRERFVDFLNTFLVLISRFITVSQASTRHQILLLYSLSHHPAPTIMLAIDDLERVDYFSAGLRQEWQAFLQHKTKITNQLNKTISFTSSPSESISFSLDGILGGLNQLIAHSISKQRRLKLTQEQTKEKIEGTLSDLTGFTDEELEYFIYPQVPVTLEDADNTLLLQELKFLEEVTSNTQVEKEISLLREVEEFKGLVRGVEDLLLKTFLLEVQKIFIDDLQEIKPQLNSVDYDTLTQEILLSPLWAPNIFCFHKHNPTVCKNSFLTPTTTVDSSYSLQKSLVEQEEKMQTHLRHIQELVATSQGFLLNLLSSQFFFSLVAKLNTLQLSRSRRFNLTAQAQDINLFRVDSEAKESVLIPSISLPMKLEWLSQRISSSSDSGTLYTETNEVRALPRVLLTPLKRYDSKPNYKKVLTNNLRFSSNLWEVFSSVNSYDSAGEILGLLEEMILLANKLTEKSKTKVEDSIRALAQFNTNSALLLVVQQLIGNVDILLPHQRKS